MWKYKRQAFGERPVFLCPLESNINKKKLPDLKRQNQKRHRFFYPRPVLYKSKHRNCFFVNCQLFLGQLK